MYGKHHDAERGRSLVAARSYFTLDSPLPLRITDTRHDLPEEIAMHRLALAALSPVFLAACEPVTTELTDAQNAEIAAQVNAVKADVWDAWRDWDVARVVSYYFNSPDFAWADDGQLFVGWAAFNEAVKGGNLESQTITFNESRTTVLAADAVHSVEQGTYSVTDSDGVTGPAWKFAFSALWIHRDGEWKVHFSHISRIAAEGS